MSLIPDPPHDTQSVTPEELKDATPTLAPGAFVAGRYRVEGVLGRGGYAVVYRAVDQTTGERVALKVLRADRASAVAVRRLQREAESAGAVRHPNVVRVLDHGVAAEGAFLAMELVAGETLRERIARGALPVDEAVRVASGIGAALEALHEMGLVHRDLKPSNVLLGADGSVRVADLGLVTALDPEDETRATRADGLVGTLEYLSPEQALGQEVDGRSDLYSLGVVLFEMLAGQLPFSAKSSLGSVLARVTTEAARLSDSRPDAPAWLVGVVRKLLEKDPARRYASAAEVLGDLQARRGPVVAEAEVAEAGARSREGSARRRRARLSALAAGLAVLAVAAGLGLSNAREAASRAVDTVLFSARVEGGVLRGVNRAGDVLWTQAFDQPLVDATYGPGSQYVGRMLLVRPGPAGENEVWIVVPDSAGKKSDLRVYDARGQLRLRREGGRPADFGGTRYETFVAARLHSFPDTAGRARVFLQSNHRSWFPAVLEELDAQGRTVGDFWTAGQIVDAAFVQFRGRTTIALFGYHNDTRSGALALLDPQRPYGRTPVEQDAYRCRDCGDADPLELLLFPRSDALAAHNETGAAGATMVHEEEDGGLALVTTHGHFASPTSGLISADVHYSLDAALRVKSLTPAASFRELHQRLFEAGRIGHRFGPADERALRRVRRWDGRRFVELEPAPAR